MDPHRLLDGRLKLRHLTLVTAIAERGSVVRAAEELRVTQPVVTRGLRELEVILGARLFDRGPRGVTATAAGEVFIAHAWGVLAQLRQAAQHVTELSRGEVGTVTVGTHMAGSNLLLPRAVARVKRERPRLTVVVKEASPDVLSADVAAGRIDLAVGRLIPVEDGGQNTQIRLYIEPIRLVTRTGHPAQALSSPTLAELVGYPWILPISQTALRHELEQVFFDQGVTLPDDRIECTSILTLRTLLIETDAIAALPTLIAQADDQLAPLATPLSTVHRVIGVTIAADRTPSPGCAALLTHLREVATDIRRTMPVVPHDDDRAPATPTSR